MEKLIFEIKKDHPLEKVSLAFNELTEGQQICFSHILWENITKPIQDKIKEELYNIPH